MTETAQRAETLTGLLVQLKAPGAAAALLRQQEWQRHPELLIDVIDLLVGLHRVHIDAAAEIHGLARVLVDELASALGSTDA